VTTPDEPNMNTIANAEVPGLTKAQNPIQIVVLIAALVRSLATKAKQVPKGFVLSDYNAAHELSDGRWR
jgi:hypothetical protein